MVYEFPELQGVMGREYARLEGEDPRICTAIYEHYLPVQAGGQLPSDNVGAFVSIADKIDTVCGCFGVGLIPTGTADPYALRRCAIGILNIILDRGYRLPLPELVGQQRRPARGEADPAGRRGDQADVVNFFRQRFFNMLTSFGYPQDVVDAVLSASFDEPQDALERVKALADLKGHADFEPLAVAFKRVVNIIKGGVEGGVIRPCSKPTASGTLFETAAEGPGQRSMATSAPRTTRRAARHCHPAGAGGRLFRRRHGHGQRGARPHQPPGPAHRRFPALRRDRRFFQDCRLTGEGSSVIHTKGRSDCLCSQRSEEEKLMSAKYVYFFGAGKAEGKGEMKNLLGGKGANLAEMTAIGLPVPPGFTITTEVCIEFYKNNRQYPAELKAQVDENLKSVEKMMGKKFGDTKNPLLVSVRSGARASMPGMMDTVLNLGLNDQTVQGVIEQSGDPRFAYDSYRRFIQMYSNVVLNLDGDVLEHLLEQMKEQRGAKSDTEALRRRPQAVGRPVQEQGQGRAWPGFPAGSPGAALGGDRRRFRLLDEPPRHHLPQAQQHPRRLGDRGQRPVDGFRQHGRRLRHRRRLYPQSLHRRECLLRRVPDQCPGGGRGGRHRTPQPINKAGGDGTLPSMEEVLPESYAQLMKIQQTLEKHYRDMQDIEFTIEKHKLYMLQTRNGKRTAQAAVKVAVDMVREGLISDKEAVLRVQPEQLDQLLHPSLDPKAAKDVIAKGLPASPGAVSGEVVFSADEAETAAKIGLKVILVRIETSPEDIHGMHAAQGILTARGGMTSHAAVVARGMGKCCVAGCGDIKVDYKTQQFVARGGVVISKGDIITLDGSTGEVMNGAVPTVQPALTGDFGTLMEWVDKYRRLRVRTNADTPHDSKVARGFGAEGIGLCRTEHMFFEGERIMAVREMILAADLEGRKRALSKILPMQKGDFLGIFREMKGLPVTIRLLDPPLHEFLPHTDKDIEELAAVMKVPSATLKAQGGNLHEFNPMLGHRGCRLGITFPEIYDMQVQAIMEAACELIKEEGYEIVPEIMIPLVGEVKELAILRANAVRVADEVIGRYGVKVEYLIGTMIELPRAALTADQIATEAEFFSFGTNDLTQTTYGLSRDDAGKFLPFYVEQEIFPNDPFVALDQAGVGQLVRMGCEKGGRPGQKSSSASAASTAASPPASSSATISALTTSPAPPFGSPIARLAAAHAALLEKM
jgi:pyruvate, orthophosphate dikinase